MPPGILFFTFVAPSLLPLTSIVDKYWKIGKSLPPSIAILLNQFSNVCHDWSDKASNGFSLFKYWFLMYPDLISSLWWNLGKWNLQIINLIMMNPQPNNTVAGQSEKHSTAFCCKNNWQTLLSIFSCHDQRKRLIKKLLLTDV